jgi:hypothetical protein
VEEEKAAIAKQRRGKHVSIATNKYATIEELLEAVLSGRSTPRLYNEDHRDRRLSVSLELHW